jgi:hypothetical protein
MKRNLALFLTMTAAALAQTPTVSQKPAPKPSSQTVKVAPVIAVQSAKPSPNTVKVVTTPAAKLAAIPVTSTVTHPNTASALKTSAVPAGKAAVGAMQAKTVAVAPKTSPAAVAVKQRENTAKAGAVVVKTNKPTVKQEPRVAAKTSAKTPEKPQPKTAVAVQDSKTVTEKKEPSKTINAVGRRDPFVSPVINMGAVGSGCSSGKRCLAIDQIALKGVVRSETGMIAVVVNAMDKAYFLRENDPVFNGYVTKITGDSIVFKETFKDKLGKPLTRDITKTISRPVA